MSNDHYKATARSIANALDNAGIKYDVYQLLNLADTFVGQSFIEPTAPPETTHTDRVLAAIQSREVMQHMHDNKKINAIKELRILTNCGLKEAKDAVEDYRVTEARRRFTDYDETFDFYHIADLSWVS